LTSLDSPQHLTTLQVFAWLHFKSSPGCTSSLRLAALQVFASLHFKSSPRCTSSLRLAALQVFAWLHFNSSPRCTQVFASLHFKFSPCCSLKSSLAALQVFALLHKSSPRCTSRFKFSSLHFASLTTLQPVARSGVNISPFYDRVNEDALTPAPAVDQPLKHANNSFHTTKACLKTR
jgi:hypothetical protein